MSSTAKKAKLPGDDLKGQPPLAALVELLDFIGRQAAFFGGDVMLAMLLFS